MHYNHILKQVLIKRIDQNKSYSLRTFAYELKMAPSMISMVLSGKKRISLKKACEIVDLLDFTEKEKDIFLLLVQRESSKSQQVREMIQRRLIQLGARENHFDLSVEEFRMVSDWYHSAIFELIGLGYGDKEPQWMAHTLGIKEIQAEDALMRLEGLSLISKNEQGLWQKNKQRLMINSTIPSSVIQKFYHQSLKKINEAIDDFNPDQKVIGSEVLCFSDTDLPIVRRIMDEYFEELIALSVKSKKNFTAKNIYQAFSVFYPLSNIKEPYSQENYQ